MLPLHKIKLSSSESLCTPSKAEKRLLSLIKKFPDPPLPHTSPTLFNFTYTLVKSKTPCSPVDHGCEKKSNSKESTVSLSSLELLNFLEVNTCFTKAIVASEWILFTLRISGWKNLCIQRWNCLSFIQKLHFIQIGSCDFGYRWTIAFLYKLTITIWNLWQYKNDVLLPDKNGLTAVARRLEKNPILLPILFLKVLCNCHLFLFFPIHVLPFIVFSSIAGPLTAVSLLWVLTAGSLKM